MRKKLNSFVDLNTSNPENFEKIHDSSLLTLVEKIVF